MCKQLVLLYAMMKRLAVKKVVSHVAKKNHVSADLLNWHTVKLLNEKNNRSYIHAQERSSEGSSITTVFFFKGWNTVAWGCTEAMILSLSFSVRVIAYREPHRFWFKRIPVNKITKSSLQTLSAALFWGVGVMNCCHPLRMWRKRVTWLQSQTWEDSCRHPRLAHVCMTCCFFT